ncbi:MAG: PorT family protein [Bacteroidales bacterium]|jgi:hypothetical protein|nr:PorT family protein [Bacteroidales bacterium]
MKKIIILILAFFAFCVPAFTPMFAKEYKAKVQYIHRENPSHFHWGFLIGVSAMDFSVKMDKKNLSWNDTLYSLGHKFAPGFTVGIIGNMRLHKYWDLRLIPSLSLAERTLTYNMISPAGEPLVDRKKVESVLIEIPLDIKWKAARMINNRPYVVLGVRYTGDLAALGKKKDDSNEDYEMKIFRNDLGFSLGAGWEFYMPYNNKICLEIKMYFGLRDLLNRDNNIYCNGIDRLTSRILQFNIMFENN